MFTDVVKLVESESLVAEADPDPDLDPDLEDWVVVAEAEELLTAA